MRRVGLSALCLIGSICLSQAQVVDFTSVDVQTETVKVVKEVDKSLRPTGLMYGFGAGIQSLDLSSSMGGYTPSVLNIDMRLLDWQITPQLEWNIFSLQMGGIQSDYNGRKSSMFLNLGTQFAYFFSPKAKGSFFASGRIGYAFSDYFYKDCGERAEVDGLTLGVSAGYAWKYVRLEAVMDLLNAESEVEYNYSWTMTHSGVSPSFGLKATFFFSLLIDELLSI